MERIFARFWKTKAQRTNTHPGLVLLEDELARIELFARCCSGTESISSVGGSLLAVGFTGAELLLPMAATWTKSPELNMSLLRYLIMKCCAVRALNISFDFPDRSRTWPRLKVLVQMPVINQWLDDGFSGFPAWEAELLSAAAEPLRKSGIHDLSLYQAWKSLISSRPTSNVSNALGALHQRLQHQKRNDTVLAFLHATVPLPFRNLARTNISTSVPDASRARSAQAQTQKSRKQKEMSRSVDDDKKGSINPVMHSFEKMSTIDDYDGGRQIESGDDELNEHAAALDEIELNRHTTTGDSSSVYRQNNYNFSRENSGFIDAQNQTGHVYSEWSVRQQMYWRAWCTVNHRIAACEKSLKRDQTNTFRSELAQKYGGLIESRRQALIRMLNVPLWRNRQIDGSELDLDSIVRAFSEPKGVGDSQQIYARKERSRKDISLLVLADCSWSTDSWVGGKRVIDVIRESLGIAGLAFDGVFDEVMIAGTSSATRHNIDFCQVKNFSEKWDVFFENVNALEPREQGSRI